MAKFGVIESSIFRSRKFRPMSERAKLVYLTCHISPHRNAIGCYNLPLIYLADDLRISTEEAEGGLREVIDAGLVQYDFEESIIRVVSWERKNAPQGPTEAIGRMTKNFDEAPLNPLTIAAFLSFSLHILHKAIGTAKGGDGWNLSDARSKMEKMIFHRLEGFANADTDMFITAMGLFNGKPNDEIFGHLWDIIRTKNDTLYDTLYDTLDIPSPIYSGSLDQGSLIKEHRSKNTDQRPMIRDQRSENKGGIAKKSTSAQSPPDPSPRESASRGSLTGKGKGKNGGPSIAALSSDLVKSALGKGK